MKIVTPAEFAELARRGSVEGVQVRLAGAGDPQVSADRTITYRFSDASVGRDGFTIAQDGWDLEAFLANPVFLWAHDTSLAPIGRVSQVGVVGGVLRGAVDYAPPDLSLFADMIFRMVKGGYLSAVSTSWGPQTWRYSTDKARPGAIDFITQELWEVSQVTVPGLATALVEARAAGIDTQPLVSWAEQVLDGGGMVLLPRAELEELRRAAIMPKPNTPTSATARKARASTATSDWKCGADRTLPVDDTESWDGPAATKRMLDACGFDGDTPDVEKARRGFLTYDSANPSLRGSYKLPFADLIGGELKATKGGLKAAAGRLSQTDIPQAVQDEARSVLDHYEAQTGTQSQGTKPGLKRGLYSVAWLAYLLEDLGYLVESAQIEAAAEGDGSTVPAMMAEACKALGAVLVAMTAEEVAELVAGDDTEVTTDGDGAYLMTASAPDKRSALLLATRLMRERALGRQVTFSIGGDIAHLLEPTRAGRVLSAANEEQLRDAHGMMSSACDIVRGVFEQNGDTGDEGDGSGDPDPVADDDAQARAIARARYLKLKSPTPSA